ncbi:MAG: methionyl-tRNA formyltransferase [candidate division Zixibacteria bacterium]
MRLLFFGTPDFASQCLRKILSSKHSVVAVVTAPDRPVGRGRRLTQTAVKTLAHSQGLEVLQPERLKDTSFLEKLEAFGADIFCVVAFRILPEDVFSMPPKGCVNLHASLLPKYRGAAPINWALINGESETGLTTFFIRRKVDTGEIILQEKLEIGQDETFGSLHDRMADKGGELLTRTLDMIESGNVTTMKQDDNLASPAPKIYPEMGRVDWTKSAREIHNLVRGLSPRPAAFSYLDQKRVTLLLTELAMAESTDQQQPGSVIMADSRNGIVVSCGKGSLKLLQLKPESGKAMAGAEFVRGYRLKAGACFGGWIER